jgi:hypothetical protein
MRWLSSHAGQGVTLVGALVLVTVAFAGPMWSALIRFRPQGRPVPPAFLPQHRLKVSASKHRRRWVPARARLKVAGRRGSRHRRGSPPPPGATWDKRRTARP